MRSKSVRAMLIAGIGGAVLSAEPASSLAPAGRYAVGNDVVRDTKTALTWQRASPAGKYGFQAAQDYCAALNLGGHSSGWRLPSMKELLSIVDPRESGPAIDSSAFPSTSAAPYWSSTPMILAQQTSPVRGVHFLNGFTSWWEQAVLNSVRCVR
jgi:Protein of unknown function (DUF1566)